MTTTTANRTPGTTTRTRYDWTDRAHRDCGPGGGWRVAGGQAAEVAGPDRADGVSGVGRIGALRARGVRKGRSDMRPWHMTTCRVLSFRDRLRVLFGAPVTFRFDSPDGKCHSERH